MHKIWAIKNEQQFTAEGDYQIQLTITTGSENLGCFFGLSELVLSSNMEFDKVPVRPFKPSPSVGNALVCYSVLSTTGKALSMSSEGSLNWTTPQDAQNQIWYFVEKNGGYLMVNMENDRLYHLANETETIWAVADNTTGQGFFLLPQATENDSTTRLTVEGESAFLFQSVHSGFARAAQIYEIPCGVLGSNYITYLKTISGLIKPMQYPLSEIQADELVVPMGQKPDSEYYIYTEDKGTVSNGEVFELEMHLNTEPVEGLEGFIYFDWNRDGVFETTQPFTVGKTSTIKVTVPTEAKEGKSRVRIRLTDNGFAGADDEVSGQIFDWILYILEGQPESYNLSVKANDDNRGTVSASTEAGWNAPCIVNATPKGNSTFVCWREGLQIVSLDKEYKFTLDHETELTAYFSPNTDNTSTGIEEQLTEKNQLIQISAENRYIKIQSNAQVKKVLVFLPNGQLVAQSNSSSVRLQNVSAGSYIVKVYTDAADETAKIYLK